MAGFLTKLTSESIPKTVVNISNQLSLDFSGTKHSFRKVRRIPGMPAHLLFMASTHEYRDLLAVNVEVSDSETEDFDPPLTTWMNGLIESEKSKDPTFEVVESDIILDKNKNGALGVLIIGKSIIDGKASEIIKLMIPTSTRYKNDSAIHLSALCPTESPQSLKEDLNAIIRSVDVHTDLKE